MWSRPRFRHRLAASLVGLVGLVVAASATAADITGREVAKAPQGTKQANLDELLNRFPIGTEQVTTAPTSKTQSISRPAAGATTVAQTGDTGGSSSLWIVLLAGVGGLVVLAGSGTIAYRRLHPSTPGPASLSSSTLAAFSRALLQTDERGPRVTEHANDGTAPQHQAEAAAGAQEHENGGQAVLRGDYADVGTRVMGILEAAEVAAAQIRTEAANTATEIRKAAEAEAAVYLRRAEDEAAAIRAAAEADAVALRTEAEAGAANIRAEAASAAESRRHQAEEDVRGIVDGAEARALEIRSAAEEQARQIEAVARTREELIRDQVQPLEENLRRALDAFRGISGQLEELLEDLPKAAKDSLVETLTESAAQAETRH